MRSTLWSLGKFLQLLGLVWGAYSLFVGLNTHDAKRELTLLLAAVFQFLAGWVLVRYSESRGS